MSRTDDEMRSDINCLRRWPNIGLHEAREWVDSLLTRLEAAHTDLAVARADAVSALLAQGEAAREIEAERDVARDRLDSVDAYLSELDGMGVVMGSQVAADIRALAAVPTEPTGGQE